MALPEQLRLLCELDALQVEADVLNYRDGAPRINLGPCGRFAREFRARWNARFRNPVTIAFIMSNDGTTCHHGLIKLSDGRYFDGGNGVMTDTALMRLFSESRIDEMKDFDLKLLDQRSYGLDRTYPECPNYSDDFTLKGNRETIGRPRC